MLSNLFILSDEIILRAGQLQGIYSLMSAFLGAAAIIASIFFTARFTLKSQKYEKIAEAKRDVYLELIAQWEKYKTTCFSFKNVDREYFSKEFLKEHMELNALMHKTSFISSSKIRFEIQELVSSSTRKFKKINPLIAFWYESDLKHDEDSMKNKIDLELEIFRYMGSTSEQILKLETLLRNELGILDDPIIEDKISKSILSNYDLTENIIKNQN